jgi:hypothetical protein
MSEYQCYEFVALDRPLTARQMAELRAISTRAEISATRFWNEYQWGDLKADPARLVERYFDVHLYFANWGTHRLMLRVPKARLAAKGLKPYFVGSQSARLASATDHVVLDLVSDTEEPDDDEESRGLLAALSPLRAELMRGDLRPAYLAWLLALQSGEIDEDQVEPPVPAGLAQLTAAQEAMVEFLRIDVDLVAAAARGSVNAADDSKPFRRWVAVLSGEEKAGWLRRAVDDPELALGNELLRAFRESASDGRSDGRRTVAKLRELAEAQRNERDNADAVRAKKAQEAAERARQGRLTKLRRDLDGAWAKLENLVESSRYDEAMGLAVDLRDLAVRDQDLAEFAKRFEAMRRRQLRRRGFFDRWKSVGGVA